MSINYNNPRGSIWRKWDLQIQPIKSELLSNCEAQKEQIEESIKEYIQKAIENKLNVIAITDHNTGYAIDLALEYKKNETIDIKILPGVELDSNSGEHIIVIFNQTYKEKLGLSNWKEVVDSFLQTTCNIERPFFENDGRAKKINKTTEALIKQINDEDIGLVIFAHCMSDDSGFFKRCGDASRRQRICQSFLEGKSQFIFEIKGYNQKEEVLEKFKGWFGEEKSKLFTIIASSDAHNASDVGKYFTWIKADPTFEGLKQIIYEPEERVYIGETPEILKRVRENKTKFINSIKINQISNYEESKGVWFKNVEIPLNSGLVAIIGNKGSGKSALTDIISLCGNSHHRYEDKDKNKLNDFSFLTEEKFLKDGLAKYFEAELVWESEECIKKNLGGNPDKNSPERVRYLPQNFFERLTNNLETYDFERTLEEVVFSHIPDEHKLGKKNFNELIEYKKKLVNEDINEIRKEIEKINKQIIELEKKSHPDYEKQLQAILELKKKELDEHEKIKPEKVSDPRDDERIANELKEKQKELEDLVKNLRNIESEINQVQGKFKEINLEIEELRLIAGDLKNWKTKLESYVKTNKEIFSKFGLEINDIIKFDINENIIEQKIKDEEEERKKLEDKLLTEEKIKGFNNISDFEKSKIRKNSLKIRAEELKKEIENINNQLSDPQKKYQQYLEELKEWEEKRKQIEGDENTFNTIKWFEKEITYIDSQLINDLTSLRNERIVLSLDIYKKKKEIVDIYKNFKDKIEKEIQEFKNILGEYEISIDASLKIKSDFYEEFLKFINQSPKGSFRGTTEGKSMLINMVKEKKINTEDGMKSLLYDFIDYLENDKRDEIKESDKKRYIKDQILKEEKWIEFYNYIFFLDYIDPTYELKLGNKNLSQLSPGEKGALLIVFYLLLDKEDIPLIIDQPEENLDNESVYKILMHFIRFAKNKRQIIIVTHNPNLAIVGDAEQIIFVKIDKKNNNTFSFESGAIENPQINKHASDILEGTLKAFDIRRLKYFRI